MSKQTIVIDMSHHQATFSAVRLMAQGVSAVWHKVGEGFKKNGRFHEDDKWKLRRNEARAAGLMFGGYWFFRCNVSGSEQADAFCSMLGPLQAGDMPPMLDFETDDETPFNTQLARAKEFLDYVENRTGMKCLIYIGDNRLRSHKWPSWLTSYPLWAVKYIQDGNTTAVPPIGEWKSWAIWQQNDHAKSHGITDGGDFNIFNGTHDQLKAMSKGFKASPVPTPAPAPVVNKSVLRKSNVVQAMTLAGYPKRAREAVDFWTEHYPQSNPHNWAFVDLSLKDTHPRFMLVDADDAGSVDMFLSAHGVGSDPDNDDDVDSVSNVSGSKKSSTGMFRCGELSHMSDGRPCVRLDGLEPSNSNARKRALLIHPAEYVSETKKLAGRSWGCFAVDPKVYEKIATALENGSPLYCFMGESK